MRLSPGSKTLIGLLPVLWGASAWAQAPGPGQQPPSVVAVYFYDGAQSRRLFKSADRNADDRLDLSEAAASLQTVDGIRDRTAFRILDTDRNGFVSWLEFDAHLQSVLDAGGTFYLLPLRRAQLEEREVPGANGTEGGATTPTVVDRLDKDGSGTISRAEVRALLELAGLPPELIAQFPVLDADRSGELSAAEAAPLAALLPPPSTPQGAGAGLPPRYRGADRDGDGQLDSVELGRCLQLMDPGLVRWADKVLRDADPNRSGTLDAQELQRGDQR